VLCPWKLADHLTVHVFDVKELPLPANDLEHLVGAGSKQWSGFSVRESGLVGVVLNTSHPKGRLRNTLMHEISHIYLKHDGSQVTLLDSGLLLISAFSKEQEEEADWLSGALLLPREALVRARAMRLTNAQICGKYGVSSELCAWRIRMTGVDLQMRRKHSQSS
jgi:Zn-dependent peptidase ImmA (M78 family)